AGVVVVDDVPERVAGRADDVEAGGSQRDVLPGADQHVEAEDLLRLRLRPRDLDAELALQGGDALDVIRVMVRYEDIAGLPAAPFQRRLDGLGVRGVDRRGLLRLDVVDEITVIVGAAEEDVDEQGQSGSLRGQWMTDARQQGRI